MTDTTPNETSSTELPETTTSYRPELRRDLPASLVVFLVAVPLSLGIALASNAPVMAGMIAAIVGGIMVGLLGGAPMQVSGPAAGLIVLVFGLTEQTGGDWRAVCAIIVLAGLIQIGLALVRVARYALAVSPAVVHGMLAGIGVLIAVGQVHVMLGGRPQSSALENLRDLPGQLASPNMLALGLGLFTLAILLGWGRGPTKRLKSVPAPLIAVVLATVVSLGWSKGIERIDLRADDHAHKIKGGEVQPDGPDAPVGDRGHLVAAINLPRMPDLPWTAILGGALALALIASVESLLCAVATDKLHSGPRSNLDRELLAQGVANGVSGMLGGLPITGVIVRSSANINAGARTRWSGIMHAVWVLLFVGFLPFLIQAIPKTVLAALLVLIGFRLVNLGHARELKKHGELPIYLITIGGVVFINLLAGVAIGFVVAMGRLLYQLGHLEAEVKEEGDDYKVVVRGALSFLAVPNLLRELQQIPAGKSVRIDLAIDSLDHAGWHALQSWHEAHEATGGTVQIDRVEDAWDAEDGHTFNPRSRANNGNGGSKPQPELALSSSEAGA